MLNNRRHFVFIALVITVASVFLCSCGQPSYKTLSEISLIPGSSSNQLSLKFEGIDSDLSSVKDGPSLFIGYVVSDTPSCNKTSEIKSSFAKKYGNSSSLGKNIVRPEEGKSILDDEVLYSFKADNRNVQSWAYHIILSKNNNSINSNLTFEQNGNKIKLTDNINSKVLTLSESDSEAAKISTGKYVHIFVSLTCQSTSNNSFSNIYWSDLCYLGSISM